jgi:hypothetical protein
MPLIQKILLLATYLNYNFLFYSNLIIIIYERLFEKPVLLPLSPRDTHCEQILPS